MLFRKRELLREFLQSEQAGGIILVACTAMSLTISNTQFGELWAGLWNFMIAGHSITHWINDGLMAIFFLLIGLELEREIYTGELADIKKAALPIAGALGGMVVPAGIFLAFNFGLATQRGAGIPMATDIAFALAALSLAGRNIPISLKIFLTALAVIDDLGAIIIIAVFYTKTLSGLYLGLALLTFAVLIGLNRKKVNRLEPYIIGGIAMWYFMLNSGVHATISGVLLAFAIPFRNGNETSPSYKVQHFLHKPVAFIILPLFAIANSVIQLSGSLPDIFNEPMSAGIVSGLVIGKPAGILFFTFMAVKLKLCTLPDNLGWDHIFGTGILAGIGFTMSIFITLLAFDEVQIVENAKISIMIASFVAGVTGIIVLRIINNKKNIAG